MLKKLKVSLNNPEIHEHEVSRSLDFDRKSENCIFHFFSSSIQVQLLEILVGITTEFRNEISISSKGRGFRLNEGSQNSKIEFLDSIMDLKILRQNS